MEIDNISKRLFCISESLNVPNVTKCAISVSYSFYAGVCKLNTRILQLRQNFHTKGTDRRISHLFNAIKCLLAFVNFVCSTSVLCNSFFH